MITLTQGLVTQKTKRTIRVPPCSSVAIPVVSVHSLRTLMTSVVYRSWFSLVAGSSCPSVFIGISGGGGTPYAPKIRPQSKRPGTFSSRLPPFLRACKIVGGGGGYL